VPKRRAATWHWILHVAMGLTIFTGFLALAGLSTLMGERETGDPRLKETVIEPADVPEKIAVVSIDGVIAQMGGPLSGDSFATALATLRRAREDSDVKAVVLRVSSPGGTVGASDTLYREVVRVKESGKKVVAYFDGLAASGGYYVSAPADRIVCQPVAVTGSIGVIFHTLNVEGLCQKIGIGYEAIKTGEKKDVGSIFRSMSPQERLMLQGIVDAQLDRFIGIVASGRGIDKEKVRALADGSVFTAEQALRHGLVDEIGYLEQAIAAAKKLSGLSDARVVGYKRILGLSELLGVASSSPRPAAETLRAIALEAGAPEFLYMWKTAD